MWLNSELKLNYVSFCNIYNKLTIFRKIWKWQLYEDKVLICDRPDVSDVVDSSSSLPSWSWFSGICGEKSHDKQQHTDVWLFYALFTLTYSDLTASTLLFRFQAWRRDAITDQTSEPYRNATGHSVWVCNSLGEAKDASSSLSILSCFSGTLWSKRANKQSAEVRIKHRFRFPWHNDMLDAVLQWLLRCSERWAPPQLVRQLIRCTSRGLKQNKNKGSAIKEETH